jgi:hypothetical protein
MPDFFDPTPEQTRELEAIAAAIPDVQRTFVDNHPQLAGPDRGAHQQQIAASKVLLTIADRLPAELEDLGIFERTRNQAPLVGIGRISTGLGCPHAETDADFLGLMVAFRTRAGRRIDFVTINDPTSPTDTPEEFLALLQATAAAAGTSGVLASRATLLASLLRHTGPHAVSIAAHVTGQTNRTVRSSTAYQQYWTGVVRARDVLGKFTFVPIGDTSAGASVGAKRFTEDWRARQSASDLEFDLRWISFLDESRTPVESLTRPWAHDHEESVGRVTFPKTDFDTTAAKLTTLLASELGANPGNWDEIPGGRTATLPSTRFTAARQLVYRASQQARRALPEESYAAFFDHGIIGPELAGELVRRYQQKRAAGHWVPDVGEVSIA